MSSTESEDYFDGAFDGHSDIAPPDQQASGSRGPIDLENVRRHIGRNMIIGRDALQDGIDFVQDSLAEGVRKVKKKYGKKGETDGTSS